MSLAMTGVRTRPGTVASCSHRTPTGAPTQTVTPACGASKDCADAPDHANHTQVRATRQHSVQEIAWLSGTECCVLYLPGPRCSVVPGVRWGRAEELGTPAYWYTQVHWAALRGDDAMSGSHALGRTLDEEIGACVLGGYGIPADVGLAAFEVLRDAGLLDRWRAASDPAFSETLRTALARPLRVAGRELHYRFATQRARLLAASLVMLAQESPPEALSDRALRDWLLCLPGVGLKTASWITRNVRHSNAVAILDVHLLRAGRIMGLFQDHDDVARDYRAMEQRFLTFADQLGVPAAGLDAVMWRELRRTRGHHPHGPDT